VLSKARFYPLDAKNGALPLPGSFVSAVFLDSKLIQVRL